MVLDYRLPKFSGCKRAPLASAFAGPVSATLLPAWRRATDLPLGLGPAALVAMEGIHQLLDGWLPSERGLPRSFYALSNGGQYVAPAVAARALRVGGPPVSRRRGRAHLVGMAASLMVFDRLSFGTDGARMAEMYFCLHDYMQQVPHAMRMCALLARRPMVPDPARAAGGTGGGNPAP
jgi:hypothetical protein